MSPSPPPKDGGTAAADVSPLSPNLWTVLGKLLRRRKAGPSQKNTSPKDPGMAASGGPLLWLQVPEWTHEYGLSLTAIRPTVVPHCSHALPALWHAGRGPPYNRCPPRSPAFWWAVAAASGAQAPFPPRRSLQPMAPSPTLLTPALGPDPGLDLEAVRLFRPPVGHQHRQSGPLAAPDPGSTCTNMCQTGRAPSPLSACCAPDGVADAT